MIIDTHSHCYWENLEPRIDEILANMKTAGVNYAIQIGCDIPTSRKALDLAKRFPYEFFATVGYHPESAQDDGSFREYFLEENYFSFDKNSDFDEFLAKISQEDSDFWNEIFLHISPLREFETMILDNLQKIVAVGECGLDFHYLDGTENGKITMDWNNISQKAKTQIENQKFWFLAQWKLAEKYQLPLVIHTRDAREQTLRCMKNFDIYKAVMHCFSEDYDFARELMDLSEKIFFSFSGIVTYKKSFAIQDTATRLPLERILVETDAPFLAPQPVRGQVCEPAFTRMTLEKIIELRSENSEIIENTIYENSLKCFGL